MDLFYSYDSDQKTSIYFHQFNSIGLNVYWWNIIENVVFHIDQVAVMPLPGTSYAIADLVIQESTIAYDVFTQNTISAFIVEEIIQ